MPITSLPDLEYRLETYLLELERLHQTRPGLPPALYRAEAGQRIDKRLEEIVELEQEIDAGPAA